MRSEIWLASWHLWHFLMSPESLLFVNLALVTEVSVVLFVTWQSVVLGSRRLRR